jgi:hypothetical protein
MVGMKERTVEECNPGGSVCNPCIQCYLEKSAASQHCAVAHVLAQGGTYDYGFVTGNFFFGTATREMVYSLAARTDVSVVQPRYPGTI